jgi:AraC-like DNA-binding protein
MPSKRFKGTENFHSFGGSQMNSIDDLGRILSNPNLDFRVRLVLKHVQENSSQRMSLSDMARTANLSEWHLCRLFRAELGLSPARCAKLEKMRLSVELLATTALSVKQVMARVGFNDESHFVRDFKACVGESPKQFRMRTSRIASNFRQQMPSSATNGRLRSAS